MRSIQSYFSSMRMTNVTGYLLANGWEISEKSPADQVLFLGPMFDEDDRYELFFPAQDSDPGFRDRVMRSIFNLSCIEDREPMEIAIDMAASEQPQPQEEPTPVTNEAFTSPGVSFENHDPKPLCLRVASNGHAIVLRTGDAVRVWSSDGNSAQIGFSHRGGEVEINAADPTALRVVQTRIGGEATESVVATIKQVMADIDEIEPLCDELNDTFSRADFALMPLSNGRPELAIARQQAAIIATAIAGQLGDDRGDECATPLWRVACSLINLSDAGLQTVRNADAQLWTLAVNDDPAAPRKVLAWIVEHSETTP